jgi:hypothetical protein
MAHCLQWRYADCCDLARRSDWVIVGLRPVGQSRAGAVARLDAGERSSNIIRR